MKRIGGTYLLEQLEVFKKKDDVFPRKRDSACTGAKRCALGLGEGGGEYYWGTGRKG